MEEKKKFNKTEYKNKFIAENYDRINLTVPKGQKEIIQAHADARGEKVNTFIQRAILQTIESDTSEGGTSK